MKQLMTFLFILLFTSSIFAQLDAKQQDIVDEGKELYKSEMASWYGTDIFVANHKELHSKTGGYFSYTDNKGISKCIFFDKAKKPKTLVVISFDENFDIKTADVDTKSRSLNKKEMDLVTMRNKVLEEIQKGSFYEHYENTAPNVIPIIWKGKKKAYVLTGPKLGGVMILGNDYRITFNKKNKITSTKQLHKNIIPIEYQHEEGKESVMSMHSHLEETGEYITVTDICTLMLYGKYTSWESHIVITPNHVNIWDIEKNKLLVLTKEAWEAIYKDQEERHGHGSDEEEHEHEEEVEEEEMIEDKK